MRNVRLSLLALSLMLVAFVLPAPSHAGQIPIFSGTVNLTASQLNDYNLTIQGNVASGGTLVWPNGLHGQWSVTNSTNAAISIQYSSQATPLLIAQGATQLVYGNGTGLFAVANSSGSSVSVTAASSDVVVSPSPGTGTFTVGLNTVSVGKGGTGDSTNKFLLANPVSGATAEYPMTEGAGTVINDISGNGNTGTFCANAPVWTGYGLGFNFNPYAAIVNTCVSLPFNTFRSAVIDYCTIQTPIGAGGSPQFASLPTLFGAAGGLAIFGNGALAATSNKFIPAFYPSLYRISSSLVSTAAAAPTDPCETLVITTGTTDHIYGLGGEKSYSAQGSSSGNVTGTGNYFLGTYQVAGGSLAFAGSMHYAIFYPTELTAQQANVLIKYVHNQVVNRPGYPVYPMFSTNAGPNFNCIGDSLTYGAHGTSTPCAASNIPSSNTYNVSEYGVSGDTARNQQSSFLMQVGGFISKQAQTNVCKVWIGTNDVAVLGQTSAATWSVLQTLGNRLQQQGCQKRIISTVISRNGNDTNKNALNALIRANYQKGYDILEDVAAIPAIGADAAYTNTACFYTDGVHLTGPGAGTCFQSLTGYGVIGNQDAKILNILDGATAGNPVLSASNAYTAATGTSQFTDNYVIQTPTAAATHVLPDCTGLTGSTRTVVNGSGSNNISVSTSNSQTITGSATVLPNATAIFTCELTGASTAGNYWLRTQ